MENRTLWYKILVARYGEVGGSITEGGMFNSVWWNNLTTIRRGTSVGVGRWIDDNIGRDIGDGNNTLFWWDPWIDGVVLKNTFSRLFSLKWQRWLKCMLLDGRKRVKLGDEGVCY